MDLIETLRGEATGISESGKRQVEYQLDIFQHRLTVGTDHTVPGQIEIHGWIRPVFGKENETLMLEFADESTLLFSFADHKGTIHAKGEIQSIA